MKPNVGHRIPGFNLAPAPTIPGEIVPSIFKERRGQTVPPIGLAAAHLEVFHGDQVEEN